MGLIGALSDIATGGLSADLTLWLDLSLAESYRRRGGHLPDRIEGEMVAFLTRVAAGFEGPAGGWDWTRIDAGKPVAAVTEACCRAMVRSFGGGHE